MISVRRRVAVAVLALVALAACARDPLRVEATGVAPVSPSPRAIPTVTTTVAPTLPQEALSNIRNVDLRSTILADPKVPEELRAAVALSCMGCGIANPQYTDLTGDYNDDVVIPVYDEAERTGTLVYSVQGGQVRLIFAHVGYHAYVEVDENSIPYQLLLHRKMYAAGEPACCPTGLNLVVRYAWQSGTFVELSRTGGGPTVRPYYPKDRVIL